MISAVCDLGHVSSVSANAVAVHSITTEAGTVRSVLSQCDACPGIVQTFVSEFEAYAVSALLRSRDEIARLRLDARRN